MSKRKGARQGPRPAKLTVVNLGLDLFSQPPTDDSIFGIEPHKYCPDSDSVTPVEFTLKKPNSLKWKSTFDSTLSTATGPSSVTVLTTTKWWSEPHPSPTSSLIIRWSIPSTHFPWNAPWHRPVPLPATPCKTSRFEIWTFPMDSACIASATRCPRDPCPSEFLWPCITKTLQPSCWPKTSSSKAKTRSIFPGMPPVSFS